MTPFQNWTYRCTARWMVIAGALLVALSLMVAVRADASKEETTAVAAAGSTSRPACGLGTSPSCPRGVYQLGILAPGLTLGLSADVGPVEPADGLGTSPSDPAKPTPATSTKPAPATSTWLAQTALALIFGLQLLKKAAPKLFLGDGIGFIVTLVASQLTVFTEALSRGESPSWALAKQAFVLGVLAAGGWSVAWKRGLKPLSHKFVTRVLGLPVPGWLA
jgi:hypothetical protein